MILLIWRKQKIVKKAEVYSGNKTSLETNRDSSDLRRPWAISWPPRGISPL